MGKARQWGIRTRRTGVHSWALGAIVAAVALLTINATRPTRIPAPPAAVSARVTAALNYRTVDLAALTTLMASYNWTGPSDGRWGASWWTTALQVSAVATTETVTGDRTYVPALTHTFTADAHYADAEATVSPPFVNYFVDDTLWWGVAWLDTYRLTGDPQYLATAENIDDWAAGYWSTGCGGGVDWATPVIGQGDQKNAITNGLNLELNAELAETTGQAVYQQRAVTEWSWLVASGLIRSNGLLLDHLNARCQPVGPVWSYSQGPVLAGLLALSHATGDPSYVTQARVLADASTSSPVLNPHGILRDPCEPQCSGDAEAFKGPYIAAVGILNRALPGHPYTAYLTRQATSVYRLDRMVGDYYGLSWSGPPDTDSPTRQASALDLFTATVDTGP